MEADLWGVRAIAFSQGDIAFQDVVDRYLPEIMEPFDYGPKEHYRMYDKMYYKDQPFAPLRKIDMILAYRINPIVRDLEIHIKPKGTDGEVQTYLNGTWGEMDLEPCDGVFQIVTIRDAETNEITKYYR